MFFHIVVSIKHIKCSNLLSSNVFYTKYICCKALKRLLGTYTGRENKNSKILHMQ